jgi:glycerate 2-kinase
MTRPRTPQELRDDARAIWTAAVDAVAGEPLVARHVGVQQGRLRVADDEFPLSAVSRIVVVGAGKAGAGMAAGLEQALGDRLLAEKHVTGWLNVPADCVRPLKRIHLHPARPAGVNEPTPDGVLGAERILSMVESLNPDDLCICLLSGGGSALMPAPVDGVPLREKLAITQFLSGAGANIEQLNTVRKQLSRIKGGGLARACRAGHLVTLIISDVIGDPLDVIASGPTAVNTTTAADAWHVLRHFHADSAGVAPAAANYLRSRARGEHRSPPPACRVTHHIIGNNAAAVDAAGSEAERRGYHHAMIVARQFEGEAEDVGRHLATMASRMRAQPGPDCLITGGEPVVTLVDSAERGLGGRNQQLVLAALDELTHHPPHASEETPCQGVTLLSGGTDGEDGPTDAAGAWINESVALHAARRGLDPRDHLRRNDAYHFFEPLDALLRTGPTHTNVCDVRVVLVTREPDAAR